MGLNPKAGTYWLHKDKSERGENTSNPHKA